MSERPSEPVQDPLDDGPDDPLLADVELVRGVPIRTREWLIGPVVVGLAGIVGIAVVVLLSKRQDLTLAGWMLGAIAILLIAFAVLLASTGRRAYLSMSVESVHSLVRLRFTGAWVLSLALLVSGIVSGIWFLTLCAFIISLSLQLAFGYRSTRPDSEYAGTARRLRPAFIAECLFAIVAPPVAALISIQVALPDRLASQYVTDAIVIPVVAAIALVVIVRRTAPGQPD